MILDNSKFTVRIALVSVFGALALVISIATSGIPYPIAPFLKIDFSEIIDLLAFFIGGGMVGFLTATIHFLGLMVNAQYIIGPPLKYIAVLSMYLGFILAEKIFKIESLVTKKSMVISTVFSAIIRSVIMIFVNIFIITVIEPQFYSFFESQLKVMGYINITFMDVMIYLSYVIGSYNIIQTLFAVLIAYIVYKTALRYYHYRT
jgi:riboflavin transporter FmnP